MLINYIRVYQLSGAPSNVVGQTVGNSNLTGAGGSGRGTDPNPIPENMGEGMGDFLELVMVSFGVLVVFEIGLVFLY
jgi:hypothetical protein